MLYSPIDTLRADTALIVRWQSDSAFQYNRELVDPEQNFWEWVSRWLGEWLHRLLGHRMAEAYVEGILIAIAMVMLLLIAWFVYKNHPGWFVRTHSTKMPYAVEEDTIYGVDFQTEINRALSQFLYRDAVRFLYLQTLKQLSDEGCIDWQVFKTPSQYVQEFRHPAFRRLTNEFLRVRYGHFEATEALFHQLQSLQIEIGKRHEEQEGGAV